MTVTGECTHVFRAQVWRSVNTTDPELVEKFRLGVLNLVKCPACGELTDVRVPFLYHDMARGLTIFIYDPTDIGNDPVPTLNPELLDADPVTGFEMISAGSFENARSAICELEDQVLFTRLHSENADLTEARIYAEMFMLKFAEAQSHQMATYSQAMQALEGLRSEGNTVEPLKASEELDGTCENEPYAGEPAKQALTPSDPSSASMQGPVEKAGIPFTDEENLRRCWLRAVEWMAWSAFVSQPVLPILYLFWPWYSVLASVIAVGLLWRIVRFPLASQKLATWGCLFVRLKWIVIPVMAAFYGYSSQWLLLALTLLGPLMAGILGFTSAGGDIRPLQMLFMRQLGYSYSEK